LSSLEEVVVVVVAVEATHGQYNLNFQILKLTGGGGGGGGGADMGSTFKASMTLRKIILLNFWSSSLLFPAAVSFDMVFLAADWPCPPGATGGGGGGGITGGHPGGAGG
jgi:hypothetical protein